MEREDCIVIPFRTEVLIISDRGAYSGGKFSVAGKTVFTDDFEILDWDEIENNIDAFKLLRWKDDGQIIRYYNIGDLDHHIRHYVLGTEVRYATEEEAESNVEIYRRNLSNWRKPISDSSRGNKGKSNVYNKPKPKGVSKRPDNLSGPPRIDFERARPSDRKISPDYLDGYEYEEELKDVRLNKIDKELKVRRTFIILKKRLKKLIAKYRATKYGKDPSYDKAEIPSLENAIKIVVEEIKSIQSRLDWYNRAKTEEGLPPDVIGDYEVQEFEA